MSSQKRGKLSPSTWKCNFLSFFILFFIMDPSLLTNSLTNPSLSICLYETHMASHPHARTHKRQKKNPTKENKTKPPTLPYHRETQKRSCPIWEGPSNGSGRGLNPGPLAAMLSGEP